jgi:hypothetical protein
MGIDIYKENLITTRELANLVNRSSERIRQYEDEGVLTSVTKSGKKYFDLAPSVTAIINYIENKDTSADGLTDEQIKLADLKYKTARAGKMELELAEFTGQMHRSEDVATVVGDMVARIRGAILSLPGRLAVDTAEAKTAMEASSIIKKAVDDILNEIAEYKYKPEDYKKLVAEREKWLTIKEQTEQAKTSRRPSSTSAESSKASKRQKT